MPPRPQADPWPAAGEEGIKAKLSPVEACAELSLRVMSSPSSRSWSNQLGVGLELVAGGARLLSALPAGLGWGGIPSLGKAFP